MIRKACIYIIIIWCDSYSVHVMLYFKLYVSSFRQLCRCYIHHITKKSSNRLISWHSIVVCQIKTAYYYVIVLNCTIKIKLKTVVHDTSPCIIKTCDIYCLPCCISFREKIRIKHSKLSIHIRIAILKYNIAARNTKELLTLCLLFLWNSICIYNNLYSSFTKP